LEVDNIIRLEIENGKLKTGFWNLEIENGILEFGIWNMGCWNFLRLFWTKLLLELFLSEMNKYENER
jgi:hypothetical protein